MPGADTRFLVPGTIKGKLGAQAAEFGLIIGVGNIHCLFVVGHIAGNAAVADRHADFVNPVNIEKARVEFVCGPVYGIQGEVFGFKQAQDVAAERDQQFVQIRGGMDAIGDGLHPLGIIDAGLKGGQARGIGVWLWHDWFSNGYESCGSSHLASDRRRLGGRCRFRDLLPCDPDKQAEGLIHCF